MTTYTMILEKVCVLTDTVEIEANSLNAARQIFNANEQAYFEDADFDFPHYDDATLIGPYLYGAKWEKNDGEEECVRLVGTINVNLQDPAAKQKTFDFDFLPQSASINALLNACIAALPSLPEQEQNHLVAAMREFECCGSSVIWSSCDVDSDDAYGLTEVEKREAISRFIRGQECTDEDWAAIDSHARDVVSERSPKGGKKSGKKSSKKTKTA
jgi:hypothetical protein